MRAVFLAEAPSRAICSGLEPEGRSLRSAGMSTRSDSMASARFDEGGTHLVSRLHILAADGRQKTVQDAAVVFTPGRLFVQEAGLDGYVSPRERVLLVEGVTRPR